MTEYKAYRVFLPVAYLTSIRWTITNTKSVIAVDGIDYAPTGRIVTSNIGYEDAAIKYIESIRDVLHGWRSLAFDRFVLVIQYHQDRSALPFYTDDIIEKDISRKEEAAAKHGSHITTEFFARRGSLIPPKESEVGALRPKYVPPEGVTITRRKTKRGAILTVIQDEQQGLARIEITDTEELMTITSILGKAGIAIDLKHNVSKHTWEDALPQHKRIRGPMMRKNNEYPGYTIYFMLRRMDKVLLSLTPLLEEGEYRELL